jgi:ribosome-associated protein
LAKIPLEPILADAITEARELKSHEAIRRQLQYIGKLMRNVDPEPIQAAIDLIESKSQQSKAQFHLIERWRDKLIAEDDNTLQAFLETFPDSSRQHLRQLVRNAKKHETADTELFRYVRKVIETKNK